MELDVLVPGCGFPRLGSAVTLLRNGGRCALVDSGSRAAGPRLVAALRDRGVEPDDVDWILTTHLHYDHCGNHLLFPHARFLVAEEELADAVLFLTTFDADRSPTKEAAAELLRSRNQHVKPFYVRSIVREVAAHREFYDRVLWGDPRFVPVCGTLEWAEGVRLLPTPGHTRGHLSVEVCGVRRGFGRQPFDVLVAGDAVFDARDLDGEPDDLPLVVDADLYLATRAALLSAYRWLVPGHGTLVESRRAPAERAA